jgi:hypothetical protein
MQQPPGWGSPNQQQGYGQQGYGPPPGYPPPPPKKKTSPWTWLGAIFGAMFLCGGLKACGKGASEGSNTTSSSRPREQGASAPQTSRKDQEQAALPWVAEVHANCERYKGAPNEIKKSAIFNENAALVAKASVKSVKGKLARLSTNQGGDELTIEVDVGDVELSTEGLMSPIRKGSAIYTAASEMSTGQCVVFSADHFKPSSLVEQSKVCDTEYFANFTALAACP